LIPGSGHNCVMTLGKLLTPICLDTDSICYYMESLNLSFRWWIWLQCGCVWVYVCAFPQHVQTITFEQNDIWSRYSSCTRTRLSWYYLHPVLRPRSKVKVHSMGRTRGPSSG